MNTLAVILARSGSVGLKDKHLRLLLGRPVIAYTFDHARQSRRLDRVVVSSDCPQILALAETHGFPTVLRPAELATSEASVQDVMLHAMDAVESSEGFVADSLVVLYGNVPARGAGVIDRAVELLEQTGCDSVRSFCPVGKWHPAWMSRLEGGRVVPLRPGSIHRRQDLEPLLLHDGAVVAVSRASMLRGRANRSDPHAFFGVDRRGFETAAGETVEIDAARDLFWAEAVLRERELNETADRAGGPVGGTDIPVCHRVGEWATFLSPRADAEPVWSDHIDSDRLGGQECPHSPLRDRQECLSHQVMPALADPRQPGMSVPPGDARLSSRNRDGGVPSLGGIPGVWAQPHDPTTGEATGFLSAAGKQRKAS